MVDILVPTIKTEIEMVPFRCDIEAFSIGCRVITTCKKVSAAINRNIALDSAKSDIVIMIDDDIRGFYPGWWEDMIKPLEDPGIVYTTANLISETGSLAPMMFRGAGVQDIEDIPRMPTAAVAFRNDGIRFHEGYIGSGFEDDDFCELLREKYPNGRFVINNKCKLVHENEMKNQHGKYFEHNKALFEKRWPVRKCV